MKGVPIHPDLIEDGIFICRMITGFDSIQEFCEHELREMTTIPTTNKLTDYRPLENTESMSISIQEMGVQGVPNEKRRRFKEIPLGFEFKWLGDPYRKTGDDFDSGANALEINADAHVSFDADDLVEVEL